MPAFRERSGLETKSGDESPYGFLPQLYDSAKQPALTAWRIPVSNFCAVFSAALLLYRAKKCLHRGQHVLDDDVDPFSGGVNPVRLIEFRIGCNPLQKEPIKRHVEGLGKIRIDRVETG